MKYLNKRDKFLKIKNYSLLTEEANPSEMQSGPFANDVGWNDSLLGRLINHIIRKAKVKANMLRMKPLIERLKDEFQRIIDESTILNSSSENQLLVVRITLVKLFEDLIKAVEDGQEVTILISLTDTAINELGKMSDFDKKNILLEELKKFKEFLEQFKDSKSGNDKDNEDNKDDKDSSNTNDDVSKVGYVTMVKNLKALALILTNYTKVSTKDSTGKDGKVKATYITKAGDTLVKIQSDITKNPNKLDINTLRTKNIKLAKYKQDNVTLPTGMLLLMEANTFGTGGAANRGTTVVGEDHLTQAFNKLKKDIEVLISAKEKGLSVDYALINDIATKTNDTKNKELVKNLYNEINRYLVGDKKATIQEKDKLYEGIELLSDKNKTVIIAEKIARFAKRAFQFEKENLYGGLGDLKVPLQTFVTTLREINKLPIVTIKKESNIFSYSLFLEAKNILDNQGGGTKSGTQSQAQGEQGQSDSDIEDIAQKIRDFFNENCKEVIAFKMTDEEIKSLNDELEKEQKDTSKDFVFGMDPVLEIMGLFIKAYKIYTVKTITKRTEKVDTNTLAEYTSFGGSSGEDTGRQGPYRNNKLFNMWEEAVRDIMKDRKYQVIFTKNAKLRLPNKTNPNPNKAEDWTLNQDGGVNFRKFINEILDGDQLYRSGNDGGKVSAFVNKYFGDTATTPEGVPSAALDKEAAEIQAAKDANAVKLKFEKNIVTKREQIKKNTLFMIKIADEDGKNTKQRAFFITDIDSNYVYLSYDMIKKYNKYFDKLNNTAKTIGQGNFPDPLVLADANGGVRYTKIEKGKFLELIKNGTTLNFKSCDNSQKLEDKVYKVITDIFWLVNLDDNSLFVLDDSDNKLDGVIKTFGDKKALYINGAAGMAGKSGITKKT